MVALLCKKRKEEIMAKRINYADLYTLRKDGRYMGYYKGRDGKRHAVYDRDPQTLYNKIQDLEAPAPLRFKTIADAWKTWAWPKLRAGTQACYKPALERAVKEYGEYRAADLEPHDIMRHLVRMAEQDYSAQSIRVQRMVYHLIYRHAIVDPEYGLEIRTNPAVDVPLPTGMKRPTKRQAPEDAVVDVIRESVNDPFGLFPLFLLSTGMRRGEALAIQWKDVDLDSGEIHVYKQVNYESGKTVIAATKTSASVRVVPILPDLRKALLPGEPEEYIFHGKDPTIPMASRTMRRWWDNYCDRHGLTLTPHVLRHSYATMLYEAGVDVYTAQRLLGHSKIDTTMAIYTHLREKKQKESIDKLVSHVQAQLDKKTDNNSDNKSM